MTAGCVAKHRLNIADGPFFNKGSEIRIYVMIRRNLNVKYFDLNL